MALMRTGILLAGLTALFLVYGFLIGGDGGMVIALVVAMAICISTADADPLRCIHRS